MSSRKRGRESIARFKAFRIRKLDIEYRIDPHGAGVPPESPSPWFCPGNASIPRLDLVADLPVRLRAGHARVPRIATVAADQALTNLLRYSVRTSAYHCGSFGQGQRFASESPG